MHDDHYSRCQECGDSYPDSRIIVTDAGIELCPRCYREYQREQAEDGGGPERL